MTVFYGKRPQTKGIGSRIKVITPVADIPIITYSNGLVTSGDITLKTLTDELLRHENAEPEPESIKKKV